MVFITVALFLASLVGTTRGSAPSSPNGYASSQGSWQQYAGDYSKYMPQQNQGSSASQHAGQSYMQQYAGSYMQQGGPGDYSKYMGDYSKYAGDYSKYMSQQSGPAQQQASPLLLASEGGNTSSQPDWKDAFMKKYSSEYMPKVHNTSDQNEWRDAFMKKYAGEYLVSVHNTSDQNEWRDAFMKKYAGEYMPKVHNTSDQNEWRDAFMKKYASEYMPKVHNTSDQNEWRDAFMKKFAAEYLVSVHNTSDQNEWRDAFMKKYASEYMPKVHNTSDQNEWRDAFMKKYAGEYMKNHAHGSEEASKRQHQGRAAHSPSTQQKGDEPAHDSAAGTPAPAGAQRQHDVEQGAKQDAPVAAAEQPVAYQLRATRNAAGPAVEHMVVEAALAHPASSSNHDAICLAAAAMVLAATGVAVVAILGRPAWCRLHRPAQSDATPFYALPA